MALSDRLAEHTRELVAGGAILLDVRTPSEFCAGHLEGAKNIPLQELPARLNELGKAEGTILVYCRSGKRSAQAAALLASHGFGSVRDVGSMSNCLK